MRGDGFVEIWRQPRSCLRPRGRGGKCRSGTHSLRTRNLRCRLEVTVARKEEIRQPHLFLNVCWSFIEELPVLLYVDNRL
jgi:hypothetical protein